MDDSEEKKIVSELLKKAYDLYCISCRIKKVKPLDFEKWFIKRECGNCIHVTTPKARVQCYTLTKAVKNIAPFIPQNVIPAMDELAKNCKRYEEKQN